MLKDLSIKFLYPPVSFLYQIIFDDRAALNPTDLQSGGKTVNAMIKELVEDTGYLRDRCNGDSRQLLHGGSEADGLKGQADRLGQDRRNGCVLERLGGERSKAEEWFFFIDLGRS